MKNKIRIFCYTLIGLYVIYSIFFIITNPLRPKYKDCGEIISKSTDEVVIKHGTSTELYLNIKFNNSGFKSIYVEPTTYFKHKKGDIICFNLQKEMSVCYDIIMFSGYIFTFVILITVLSFIVIFLLEPFI